MTLIEFVEHLHSLETAEKFIASLVPDVDAGQVDIFLKSNLDEKSEVKLFDAETLSGEVEIFVDGVTYVNLFPFSLAQEIVEAYVRSTKDILSNAEIAKRLIAYRITDA